MSDEQVLTQFDEWIKDGSDVAALVLREWLEPVEGKDAVIFPPTYNLERTEGARRFKEAQDLPGFYLTSKGQAYGYNMDRLDEKTSVCQIDSVGSQANRMEPIFMRPQYQHLVPQVTIKAGNREVNLLQAGHRGADAIARYSDLAKALDDAFRAYEEGDASKLAKIAPTSLVFGAWDSRATQVKLPRVVRSVIRAYDVKPVHRSAQYIPPLDYVAEGLLDKPENKTQQDAMSEQGLSHAPAAWTHGGVQVYREIRRDAILKVGAVQTLGCAADEADGVLILRRYVLGLALVSFAATPETFLREGCELVPDSERKAESTLVRRDGNREPFAIDHDQALAFATAAAEDFGVGEARTGTFSAETAKQALGLSKQERKASRRRGRSTSET